MRPFFDTNQLANAAAVLMLTYDENQKATKAHCRLAFSAQPQSFFLPLLVELHGSTDTTARKSAIIECHAPFYFFLQKCLHD